MRQVFLSKSGQILVAEAPAPECGPGEVLIGVAWSVISTGTEARQVEEPNPDLGMRLRHAVKLGRMGLRRLRERGLEETLRKARVREGISAPMGYSVSGIVRAAGPEAGDLAIGSLVAAGGSAYAHHAEIVAVPRNLVVPVPEGVSLRAASFTTVGAIALQGVRRATPQVGETAVVIGLGLLGQLAVQILTAAGCRVIGVDPLDGRIDLARHPPGVLSAGCGPAPDEIEPLVRAVTRGIGADVVLICASTASSEPANTALRIVRQRGRVVVVGDVGMELVREAFYRKEVEFTISCSYGPGRYDPTYEEGGVDYPPGFVRWTENRNMQAFLELVQSGRVAPEGLISAEHPLEEAAAAFETAKSQNRSGVAAVLRYPDPEQSIARTVTRSVRLLPSAELKLGVAVIGAGGFAAGTLLPALMSIPEVVLRAVVTRTSASAAKVAEEFQAERVSTDAEEVLSDPTVQAVVIATRHDLHAPLALRALAAGKHVFLEKPLGLSREQIDAVRDAALASGRIFTVGYNRRYAPLALVAKESLRSVTGVAVVDYRVNAGPVPRSHWTLDRGVGGGRVIGEACHMFDFVAFLLGSKIESIGCVGSDESPSAQDFSASLRLRDTKDVAHVAALTYFSVGSPDLAKERIEIHAGGGSLLLEDFTSLTCHGLAGRNRRLPRADKGHRAQMRYWIDAIRGRPTPLLGPEEAWNAADVALRVDEQLRDASRVVALGVGKRATDV